MALASVAAAQSPLSAIHGQAKDSAGQPIAGAEISIHNLDEQSDPVVVTGGDGSFALRQIKPGKYEVGAAHTGFQKVTMNFELAAGEDHALALTMTSDAATRQRTWPPATSGNGSRRRTKTTGIRHQRPPRP